MVTKLTPFYRVLDKNKAGYTLFIDKEEERVYKSIHSPSNQVVFWVLFFLTIILLRSFVSVHIPIENTLSLIGFLILEAIIGIAVGRFIYKYYYKNITEVFYPPATIENYIQRGRKSLKIELGVAIGIFIVYIISIALFVYDKWLIWNILSLFLISLLSITLCALPIHRFKLYQKRNDS